MKVDVAIIGDCLTSPSMFEAADRAGCGEDPPIRAHETPRADLPMPQATP